MKTLLQFLLVASFVTAASQSFAGPPPDFWRHNKAEPAVSTPPRPAPALPPGLTCARMLVPNNSGFTKGPQFHSVACTPEMMKNDWRCQQACANAKKG